MFSFTWGLPRILGCNPKQPDSSKTPRAAGRPAEYGILTLFDMLFQATWTGRRRGDNVSGNYNSQPQAAEI